jgi:type IV pilus biogenesis protein CpaD/CtpE
MRTVIFCALLLSGCAASTEGIRQEAINASYTSDRPPTEVTRCLQDQISDLQVELGDGYISASKENQFGAILLNWFIQETPTGSSIELRKTNSIAGGEDRAERCF